MTWFGAQDLITKAFRAVAVCIIVLISALPTPAQTLGMRHPAPSPDGSEVCLSYQGDLWLVSSQGGSARRLTVHLGYDSYPSWSPDGKYIAFASDRNGNFDVFVVPAAGGPETQLTWHSEDDLVSGWSPDSRRVLFHSRRDQMFEQVWEVPLSGGHERPLTQIESYLGSRSADGEKLIFTRGAVPWWRKNYRGSAACDIYSKDLKSGNIEQLTFFSGNDICGSLVPGSAELVYLSDSTGNYNLFRRNLVGGSVVQITNHRLDVHHPSLSANGALLAYELAGEIYLYDLKASQGRRLPVDAVNSEKTNDLQLLSADSGITEFAISPDGNSLAYIIGGEVFCRAFDGSSQRRLTSSPATEQDLFWSEDSRQLAFTGRSDDNNAILFTSSNDPQRLRLESTLDISTPAVIRSGQSLRSPLISPAQSRIAFVRGEVQLVVTDIKKLTERTIADKDPIGDFSWSPDGRYVVFTQRDGNWDNELFIGDSESGSVEKISEVPGRFRKPHFSADGRIIYYLNEGDLYYLYLDRQLSEMSPAQRIEFLESSSQLTSRTTSPVTIDFESISKRARRLTDLGRVVDATLSASSDRFAFATSDEGLYTLQLDDNRPQLLTTVIDQPNHLQFRGETTDLLLCDTGGRLYSVNTADGIVHGLPYHAEWSISRRAQFRQVFDDVWRAIRDRFYDNTLHGTNWEALREVYLARISACTETVDFHDLIREMLGQVNASHLNIWSAKNNQYETGLLGIIPDYEDNSADIKVLETLSDSPAARQISEIKPFDKITSIAGVPLEANANFYQPLIGTVGDELKVDLINRSGITRSVVITPISVNEQRELGLRAREKRACEIVDQLSQMKIGYVSMQQITASTVEQFEAVLKLISQTRQALLVDLRGNSGGSEHDRLLALLARKPYIKHVPRMGESGIDAPWAFAGPIALLVDERTSSDAEIVAEGFRALGLGEVIGVTTYGAVIGTEKQMLVDGSILSIPTVGWFTLKNLNLENHGVSPDVAVPLDLTKADRGEDNQITEAVKRLLEKLR